MLKRNLNIVISIALLIIIGFGIAEIFDIEKKKVNEEAKMQEASKIPLPSRIIYKNKYNKYKILNSEDKYFAEIYTLLYNTPASYTEEQPELFEENVSFVECNYLVKEPSEEDKNYIFVLENKNSELEKKIQLYTEESQTYEFKKEKSYTAKKQLTKVPTGSGFVEKIDGVYKKSIDYNRAEYKTILQELGFDIDEEIPEIEDDENIIITLSKYEIKSVETNIGNITYELGSKSDKYFANCLIYSKVVNDGCIYYNIDE